MKQQLCILLLSVSGTSTYFNAECQQHCRYVTWTFILPSLFHLHVVGKNVDNAFMACLSIINDGSKV